MDDNTTISLNIPSNIDNIHDILKLNSLQLKHVLEMGYLAYSGTIDNIYNINNKEYKHKIQNLKKQQIKELQHKDTEIENMKKTIKQLNITNEKNQELVVENLKNKLYLQFETEVKYKNDKINELKEEINTYRQNISNLHANKNDNTERIIEKNKLEIKKIRENYEIKIEKLYKQLLETRSISENSYNKGKVGEQKMLGVLTMLFPKNEIIDTHKDPNRGDFLIVCENEKKILIDNKDYSSNVPKKEIEKFHKDMETNIDVYSGILISNSSGIAKKDDFQIDIINNKPVIYLCNTNKNQEKIKCATDFLKSLMKCDNIDFSKKEIIDKLKKLSTEFKRKINKIKKDIQKFSQTMQNTVLDIENIVNNIFILNK